MNSAKVIKLPSHYSSSCFQYRNRTKGRKNRVIAALISLHFLFFFYILNMHQLVIQELRRTSNIPGLEKTKMVMVMVLCYLLSVSSAFVRFDSSAPPFAFSIFLRSLSYFLRSPTLSPSCFLLNVTSTPSSLLSFFFSAFIAKAACVFSFIIKTFGNGPIIEAICGIFFLRFLSAEMAALKMVMNNV